MARDEAVAEAPFVDYPATIQDILNGTGLSHLELAKRLGSSHFSVVRWVKGDMPVPPAIGTKLCEMLSRVRHGEAPSPEPQNTNPFASHGANERRELPLFDPPPAELHLGKFTNSPILNRLRPTAFSADGPAQLAAALTEYDKPAPTITEPAADGVSAGKNTYTYDAHTYHTKVPPQGIAEVIRQYLPDGGLVLDPFAGSGMTGVAALTLGNDVVLNELSPAASFIADRFTSALDGATFATGVAKVCESLAKLRRELYTTSCRTCGKDAEILFTVWSYRVCCPHCHYEFLLWDHCRKYGSSVREHKILSVFPCPECSKAIHKSRLPRTAAEPIFIGYKCCSPQQEEHPLTEEDRNRLTSIEANPPLAQGFYPTTALPDGVNLNQPKRQGLTSIDRFYTPRNLAALSQIWRAIHRVNEPELAGFLAFAFTSLYQRVTRLSEFRFWGGSGNTAHFNVPYIFNEANVFVTFERKAKTIRDHLDTTARHYAARAIVRARAGGFHLQQFFFPFGAGIAAEVELAHNGEPRLAVEGQVAFIEAEDVTGRRRCRSAVIESRSRLCEGPAGINAHDVWRLRKARRWAQRQGECDHRERPEKWPRD